MNHHHVATVVREDVNNQNLAQPAVDIFKFNIHNPQVFDPVLLVFAAGCSTLFERRMNAALPLQKMIWSNVKGLFGMRK